MELEAPLNSTPSYAAPAPSPSADRRRDPDGLLFERVRR